MYKQAYDMAIVGSGAAGLAAACVAAAMGQKVVVLEQSAYVGGTSATSGGMLWMPMHPHLQAYGLSDSDKDVRQYLANFIEPPFDKRMEAFLKNCKPALDFLERNTCLRTRPVKDYPDYYSMLPGASIGCRVLEPEPFNGKCLGGNFNLLRPPLPEFMLFGGMMVSRQDIPVLRQAAQLKSFGAVWKSVSLFFQYFKQRISYSRGTSLYLGNALVARLLKSALDLRVVFLLNSSVKKIVSDHGRVKALIFEEKDGSLNNIDVTKGVVLATGGVSHDHNLRKLFVSKNDSFISSTFSRLNAHSGAEIARAVGGKLSAPCENGVFGVPISKYKRKDGSEVFYPHTVTDRAKPGLIAVNSFGCRFTNEARSYHDFYLAQVEQENHASPAYLIVDSDFLWKYGLGCVRPFKKNIKEFLHSGYLKSGKSVDELEHVLSLPKGSLIQTLKNYNFYAKKGQDPFFQKGGTAYEKYLGDINYPDNPCIAPIEKPPFYSVKVFPGDLGMSSGIETNENAQVMNHDSEIIDGLYACGNDMSSVMQGEYPGPGITLGPAITFAYIASQHCASRV